MKIPKIQKRLARHSYALVFLIAAFLVGTMASQMVSLGDSPVATLNNTANFQNANWSAHDTLEVNSPNEQISARNIQMLQGNPDSTYKVNQAWGGGGAAPVPVADVWNRKGQSFYTVHGDFVAAGGGRLGGAVGSWYTNYNDGPARVVLHLKYYMINPGDWGGVLLVSLVGAAPNTSYNVNVALAGDGTVSLTPSPVPVQGLQVTAVDVNGIHQGSVTFTGTCGGFSQGQETGTVAGPGDPVIVRELGQGPVNAFNGPALWGAITSYQMEVKDTNNKPYANGTPREAFSNVVPKWFQPNAVNGGPSTWPQGADFTDTVGIIFHANPGAANRARVYSDDQTWHDIRVANPNDNHDFTLNTQHLTLTFTNITRSGPGTP